MVRVIDARINKAFGIAFRRDSMKTLAAGAGFPRADFAGIG